MSAVPGWPPAAERTEEGTGALDRIPGWQVERSRPGFGAHQAATQGNEKAADVVGETAGGSVGRLRGGGLSIAAEARPAGGCCSLQLLSPAGDKLPGNPRTPSHTDNLRLPVDLFKNIQI
jgi:hypothetical protein